MRAHVRRSRADCAQARQIGGLQIAQAAVQRAMVVERGAAAEVVPIDQRDVQAARRRIPRRHQAVDAAADDEQVEGVRGEGVQVADHAWRERI